MHVLNRKMLSISIVAFGIGVMLTILNFIDLGQPKACQDAPYRGVCLDGTWSSKDLKRYFPEHRFKCEEGSCSVEARDLDLFLPEFIMDEDRVVGVVVSNNYKTILDSGSFATFGAFVTLNVALDNLDQKRLTPEGDYDKSLLSSLDGVMDGLNTGRLTFNTQRKGKGYSYVLLTKSNLVAISAIMIIVKDDEKLVKRAFKASKKWGE